MEQTTHANLVSSANLTETDVDGRNRANVGSIDHLMIDKQSSKVAMP